MADATFKRSDKQVKLIQATDGTYYQAVAVSEALTSISHVTASVTTDTGTTVLQANDKRNYVVIYNPNSDKVYVSLGSSAVSQKGIPLDEKTAYEMSRTYNNLFRGQISAVKDGTEDALIYITEGE